MPDSDRPTCFIAMPITTHKDEAERYGGDQHHWLHVRESIFVPAIRDAGFDPVIPVASGSYLIHEVIVTNLEHCDLVLCDLSSNNPNVFFELGVRTSLDKPIALVWDGLTSLPFDTAGINTHEYVPTLHAWDKDEQILTLKEHIVRANQSCEGHNPLWRKFGLTQRASQPQVEESPTEAKIDLLAAQVHDLRALVQQRTSTDEVLHQWWTQVSDQEGIPGLPLPIDLQRRAAESFAKEAKSRAAAQEIALVAEVSPRGTITFSVAQRDVTEAQIGRLMHDLDRLSEKYRDVEWRLRA